MEITHCTVTIYSTALNTYHTNPSFDRVWREKREEAFCEADVKRSMTR